MNTEVKKVAASVSIESLGEQKVVLHNVELLFNGDGVCIAGFRVLGADSEEYQTIDRAFKVSGVKKAAHRGRGIDAKTDNGAEELINVLGSRDMALIVGCTKEIFGFDLDGVPATADAKTLKAIFDKRPTWKFKTLSVIEEERVFIKA